MDKKKSFSVRYKHLMLRFWKYIYLKAEKKCKNTHLDIYHTDMKCPTCKIWFSVSGLRYNHTRLPDTGDIIHVECGQCNTVSNWSSGIAPVLIRVDDKGIPVK